MQKVLEVKNLNKKIKGHIILNNISFEINKGEIYGIIGDNASGKSMLFKAITGLITIDDGEIKVFGKDINTSSAVSAHIGALIEYPGFLPQFSGFRNLELLSSIRKVITKKEIIKTMQRLGLDPHDKRSYRKYSLGMRQKLGIAAAIMESPDIVLLDEPTNNIDVESVSILYKIIKEDNKKKNTTFIITSHHMNDINALCQKVYEIKKGELSFLR